MIRRTRLLLIELGTQQTSRLLPVLEGAGHEVVRAFDVESAPADLARLQPEMIILIALSQADSAAEVARRLRLTASGRQVPILLLLGSHDPRTLTDDHWREAGFDAVLEFPCSDHELVQSVDEVLKSSGSRQTHVTHLADLADVDSELESAMRALADENDGEPPPAESAPGDAAGSGRNEPDDRSSPLDLSENIPAWGRVAGAPRTLEDVGWRQRGPDGIVLPPSRPDTPHGRSVPRRAVPAEAGSQLATIITLGAGALIAGASVAFFVWLLVYTGFEGSEAPPPLLERDADGTITNVKEKEKGDSFGDIEILGGGETGSEETGGDPAEAGDQPGIDPSLPIPYSAAPPSLPFPRPGFGPGDEPQAEPGGPGGTETEGGEPDGTAAGSEDAPEDAPE